MTAGARACRAINPLKQQQQQQQRVVGRNKWRCGASRGVKPSATAVDGAVSTVPGAGVKQRVLITGSTRGLGLALAKSFLQRGDSVFVTSRDEAKVRQTVEELAGEFGKDVVSGAAVDVRVASSVERLAEACVEAFGGVDVWINNAGSNGYKYDNLEDADPAVLEEVVLTNSLGSILCTREAIRTMKRTSGRGHVFNMEGAGSDGSATRKFAAYGHTKAGMAQLSKTMATELKDTPIAVHTISPGMVFTELISSGRNSFGSQGRMFVNALAEPADVAASQIVEKLKEATADPDAVNKTLAIKILTPDVALKKMFKRFVLGENKDRYYPEKE
jgi:chlorophyll(ide) b reductase